MSNVQKRKLYLGAFTLIELLIVMAILGFLAAGSLAGLSYGLKKGRDTQRIQAMEAAQTAITVHYSDFQSYPIPRGKVIDGISDDKGQPINGFSLRDLATTNADYSTMPPSVGIKDYFEGEWKNPPVKPTFEDSAFYYYYNDSGLGFAVCSLLELKNGGNFKTPVRSADRWSENWGCFCLGPLAKNVTCAGLTDPRGGR